MARNPDPIFWTIFIKTDQSGSNFCRVKLDFLHDIVPKKIKYSEYLQMMEEEKDNDEDSLF